MFWPRQRIVGTSNFLHSEDRTERKSYLVPRFTIWTPVKDYRYDTLQGLSEKGWIVEEERSVHVAFLVVGMNPDNVQTKVMFNKRYESAELVLFSKKDDSSILKRSFRMEVIKGNFKLQQTRGYIRDGVVILFVPKVETMATDKEFLVDNEEGGATFKEEESDMESMSEEWEVLFDIPLEKQA